MKCAYCGNKETKVVDKRESKEYDITRRRRECLKCKKRFTTYEKPDIDNFYVIKKDGRRERFGREKLMKGVERAFEKRPVSQEKIQKMVDNLELQLRKRGKEVKSSLIGELLMKKIEKMDKVAYVRFASVYKDFKDISDFKKELRSL